MIKIYGSPQSSAARCLWLLEEIGVPYAREEVNLRDPAARARFAEVFPGTKIPYFVDGEVRLFESMAIDYYLARTYAPALIPEDPVGHALIDQWSFWAITNLQPEGVRLFLHTRLLPDEERSPRDADAARAACARFLGQLEQSLHDDWLVAGRFTLADLHVASSVRIAKLAGAELGPKTDAWFARVTARPAYQKVLGAVTGPTRATRAE